MGAFGQDNRKVAVTGLGVITSLGIGKDANWNAMAAGRSGIHAITRYSTQGMRTTIGGSVDFIEVAPFSAPALGHAMARMTVIEALAQAGLAGEGSFEGQLFLAGPPVEHEWDQRMALAAKVVGGPKSYSDLFHADFAGCDALHTDFLYASIATRLKEEFKTQGSPITLTTACASGASAIQLGVEAIRRGATTRALAVGTDGSMHPESMIRFSLLSALSTSNDAPEKAAKPFAKNRDGFVMAEGAAALILEDATVAAARGATILGYIAGVGEGADTFHRTRSNPDGAQIVRCMTAAIADAGLAPDDIDHVNAHGTGTPENDKMESLGIERVFGARAAQVPVSSNKSMIGHTLTAAGAVEAAMSLLMLQNQVLLPTINHEIPDPTIPLDVVPNEARPARVRHILSNSFGFGGQNVSLVISAEPR